ncbi:uncharacterized protein LOC103697181 [Phoenix dactylifera]|uniref:Uncharacterized protein LOC103697181 n=1 Tax=Phoenix dactylifera TaxID=42345 RepID=A0A8B9AB35_PHODC|nr:uncharacterized protein LOC103697181 [Phoenix dactylifera]
METAREARRRKIMERGSERLAFITGQSRSLTPSSSFSSSRPPTLQQQQGEEENPRFTTADVLCHDDATGMEAQHKHRPIDQTFSTAVEDDETELLPKRNQTENSACVRQAANSQDARWAKGFKKANSLSRFGLKKSQVASVLHWKMLYFRYVAIALLVVMSTHGHSMGGKILGSMLNLRPPSLVLLTDAAFIIGQLLLNRKSHIKDGEEARGTRQEEFGFADNIGNALAIGLVFQKALNAAFMDCSICAVIMISGYFV